MTIEQCWAVDGKEYGLIRNYVRKLPPGVYTHYMHYSKGLTTQAVDSRSDNILDLPGLPTPLILEQMDKFWHSADVFQKFGFVHKRGILLYGPPGCGKTSVTRLLENQVVQMGGVVFVIGQARYAGLVQGIALLREAEPDRKIMTLVEDVETQLEGSNGSNVGTNETEALSLYDGSRQFDTVLHVATTNKPELVADRFIRRPGRFDLVVGLHAPQRVTREAYLRHVCNGQLASEELEAILDCTEGLSLSFVREIVLSNRVLGVSMKETLQRIHDHSTKKFSNKVGFTIGFNKEDK